MQLVHVIEVGMDVDGDELATRPVPSLYFGNSLGGIYGTILLAVEQVSGWECWRRGELIESFRLGGAVIVHVAAADFSLRVIPR